MSGRIRIGCALLLLVLGSAGVGGEVRDRRREIEREFAPRYMDVAEAAKKHRGAALVREAFARAEELAPGDERVIAFDPAVDGTPRSYDRRRLAALEADFRETKTDEARARFALALWCDEEAWIDASVEEAARALRLAPGPVAFDVAGTLSEPVLGELPLALSLSVLDAFEVWQGKLVARPEMPDRIPWEKGFRLETAHFDVRTNVSGRICRLVARALEAAREIYADVTGLEVQKRITVWIVATRGQYVSLMTKLEGEPPAESNIGKCLRDFCGVDGSRSDDEIVGVAIHEVAHGYLNLGIEKRTGVEHTTMPPWYHEGFATYCAGYGKGSLSYDRGVVLPRIARDRPLAHFREMVLAGKSLPLRDFLDAEELDSEYYYQAMAFFWFLDEMEEGELRSAYRRAIAAMEKAGLDGKDRITRGNAIFEKEIGIPLEDLESRFLAWARALAFEDR